MIRRVVFFKNYFFEFYESQAKNVQRKIDYVLDLTANTENVPEKFLKHIAETDNLYEIRVRQSGNIYRIFCCFDAGKIIVLFNGFQKKTQKTPKREIEKAEQIKQEYFSKKKWKK